MSYERSWQESLLGRDPFNKIVTREADQPHPADAWMVGGRPFVPNLDVQEMEGGGANLMNVREMYDFIKDYYGEEGLKNPQPLIHSDPYFKTGGSNKMWIPLGKTKRLPTIQDIEDNRNEPGHQNFYASVPAGSELPGDWGQLGQEIPSDQEKFSERLKAYQRHFGSTGNLASMFTPDEVKDKVLPREIPKMPGNARTIFMAGLAGARSFVDAGRNMDAMNAVKNLRNSTDVDFGPILEDVKKRGLSSPNKFEIAVQPVRDDPLNPSMDMNALFTPADIRHAWDNIQSKYDKVQLESMNEDDFRRLVAMEIQETRKNEAYRALAEMKSKEDLTSPTSTNASLLGYRPIEEKTPYGDLWDSGDYTGIFNKITNTAASSAAPTAIPMAAGFIGSTIPFGSVPATMLASYNLSADSAAYERFNKFANEANIPLGADQDVVRRRIEAYAQKDPEGFKKKMSDIIEGSRVQGGLEAGLAAILNQAVNKLIKIPGAKPGSLSVAARGTAAGMPRAFTHLMLPRLGHAVEEMGKEGVEESLTELGNFAGTEFYENIKNGMPVFEAFFATGNALMNREKIDEATEAGAVGAYMSALTKLATGKGDPEAALRLRRKAAQVIANKTGRKPEIVDARLGILQRHMEAPYDPNASAQENIDAAEEHSIMSGRGTLDDQQMRAMGIDPYTGEEMFQVPTQDTPLAKVFRTDRSSTDAFQGQMNKDGLVLGPGETVPSPKVVNGRLRRFYREITKPDGSKELVDVTYENAPK